MDLPQLRHGPVRLRAHDESDLDRIVEQINDPRTQRWITVPLPYDRSHAEAYLRQVRAEATAGTDRTWAIEVDGGFAGSIGYARPKGGVTEVGFGLHPDTRGRGLATLALRAALDHAFGVDGVEVMAWRAAYGNLASRRVAWACGFTVDGVWRGRHVNGAGRRDDAWVGSLRADDPREPTRPWWQPVELTGERVRLRPWRVDERPPSDPDRAGVDFAEGMWPTREGYEAWHLARLSRMADGEGVFWCVADRVTDEPIGHVQLIGLDRPATPSTGLLGYWLTPPARGRGLVAEAIEVLLAHAFAGRDDLAGTSGLGLHRIVGRCRPTNRGSARVLRRLGFRHLAEEHAVLAPQSEGAAFGDQSSFELLATDDRTAQRTDPAHVPVIEAGRIRLRPWQEGDRPREDQQPDAAALRYMPAGVTPTPATFDPWLAQRRRAVDTGVVHWCLADRTTDAALGGMLIFGVDRALGDAEFGYWLHPESRGRGLLADAVPAALEHAFAPTAAGGLGLRRVHAATDAENVASQKVLVRHGFTHWGTSRRSWRRQDGSVADTACFELLAD